MKSAFPISFQANASVLSYDLTAPPKLEVVRVKGRIVNSDGEAPKEIPDILFEHPYLKLVKVDSEGRFEIELCKGTQYSAFAFRGFLELAMYSAPIEFIAGEKELNFILNKTEVEFQELIQKSKQPL